jgi:hypothetical protein
MRILRVLILPALLLGMAGSIPGAFAAPAAATPFKVEVAVTPNPMSYNTDAYVSVATVPSAVCESNVVYNNGSTPTNWQSTYKNKWYPAARNGVIIWAWTFKARHLSSGRATVTCRDNGKTVAVVTTFRFN